MMKRSLVIAIGILLVVGCQPKPSASDLVKQMVVTTDYDNAVDFTKYSSYYLPMDTVSYFNSSDQFASDTLQCSGCTGYNNQLGSYPTLLTSELKTKLDLAGYNKVEKKQSPDLRVYIFIVENYNVSQSYAYNPYGYGYYGYGYGYGYGYPTVSVSDQADLYVEIFDLKNLSNGKPKLIWYCDIGDLVTTPDLGTLTIKAIDQAFTQSSYLKK